MSITVEKRRRMLVIQKSPKAVYVVGIFAYCACRWPRDTERQSDWISAHCAKFRIASLMTGNAEFVYA